MRVLQRNLWPPQRLGLPLCARCKRRPAREPDRECQAQIAHRHAVQLAAPTAQSNCQLIQVASKTSCRVDGATSVSLFIVLCYHRSTIYRYLSRIEKAILLLVRPSLATVICQSCRREKVRFGSKFEAPDKSRHPPGVRSARGCTQRRKSARTAVIQRCHERSSRSVSRAETCWTAGRLGHAAYHFGGDTRRS